VEVRRSIILAVLNFSRTCRDQLVTLTTTTPPQKVRIAGITADYGLLRTIPERNGRGTDQNFIDLQPDGNSFDMMANMIKTKT
jgi:biotin---protein ligase